MTERCWEELRRAGKAIVDANRGERGEIVNAVAGYFEVVRSPEAEAVRTFLDGLCIALESDKPPSPEAA